MNIALKLLSMYSANGYNFVISSGLKEVTNHMMSEINEVPVPATIQFSLYFQNRPCNECCCYASDQPYQDSEWSNFVL